MYERVIPFGIALLIIYPANTRKILLYELVIG